NRADFLASGHEWRTPPLWGIGLIKTVNGHTLFLHDGRARNLQEAILWHGGEAEKSKETFRQLRKADRDAIIAFLESL
ncbi:MAG: thiol oxidoreductase, partial [Rhizobacter sp.]|nr:thiol oxidoreductase [Chlorobiales bacterium]